ncbi:hypothetical protein E1A91_D06G010100v1 [Gossypium mustelinum]|uniref:CBS domain-containing protein n=3 Tax=Gossypium TaxID=3633 RepID=A0A5J5QWI4_GOSBA|nr:hypothetical protein ES319_D06G009500v1 [Gossypium barbadense]KAB2023317.1 hypothetical protein ES319_D06G009500v1 [Gossypium barbadense]TYG63203.1 hypothetical protein ES288_D06G010100v1 [Gossypium darwinii]TYI75508.1 hypothetical protein E1A91_D06G010100v1 [Gossypium mustelinum]
MQGLIQGLRSCWQERIKLAILRNSGGHNRKNMFSRTGSVETEEKGLENITVADVLISKGEENVGSWLWCRVNDNVDDAMKNMAQHNIGSLVVLKPGDQLHVAGIITERDYLRKIIGQGRSPKYTRVGEIMTDENKLITMKSDTSILQAMQLMTDNHIRHVPVIDGRIVGMVSIVDVVRAVVEQQNGELKRLNDFIKGEYY